MSEHDGLSDGQTQARAIRRRVRACFIHSIKPVKQARQVHSINRVADIRDTQAGAILPRVNDQLSISARVRVPQSIGQQVADGTPDHQAIAQHGTRPQNPKPKLFLFRNRIVEIYEARHLVLKRDLLTIWKLDKGLLLFAGQEMVRVAPICALGPRSEAFRSLAGVGYEA